MPGRWGLPPLAPGRADPRKERRATMNGAPTAPPPRPAPVRGTRPPATRLHLGHILLLVLAVGAALIVGTLWLLVTKARPTAQAMQSTLLPAWTHQGITYAPGEPLLPTQTAATTDPMTGVNAKLSALLTELERQKLEVEALKKRPTGTTVIQQGQQRAPNATPPAKQSTPMLYVSHDVKDTPPVPKTPEYTLAPGATKLACIVETAVNSDVEGYFTAKVSTNVYD